MKYMNMKKRFLAMNLQFFAGEGDGGDDGADAGEGDDQDDDDSDEDGEDNQDEKKFSQKDVDNAVKKRVAREKRKWQREQQNKNKPDTKTGDGEESEDVKARKSAEERASKAEAKNACYEAGVTKDSVDDVVALARAYMAADEDLDLEDAIEKVVKKYPQFKKGFADPYEDEEDEKKNKSWGKRHSGKSSKMSGVEKHFYSLNPDLRP